METNIVWGVGESVLVGNGVVKILLISYFFPPFNSVGGVRTGKMAAYFHEKGHDVTVITERMPPLKTGLPIAIPSDRVVTVRSFSLKSLSTLLFGGKKRVGENGYYGGRSFIRLKYWLAKFYRIVFCWPDAEVGFSRSSYRVGESVLASEGNRFDFILVSVSPFSTIRTGARLAEKFNVPLVIDYRDLWTDNHFHSLPEWRLRIERRMEAKLMKKAALLVTVSESLATTLKKYKLPVITVRNGHDPSDFDGCSEKPYSRRKSEGEFLIVYTGSVYEGFQETDLFCRGVKEWTRRGGKLRIVVVGRNTQALQESAQRMGVLTLFAFRGVVDYREALEWQQSADALIFFPWKGENRGVLTTKFFEYAGSKSPIIAAGGNDSEAMEMLKRTKNVWLCAHGNDVADAIAAIQAGEQRVPVDPMEPSFYSREEQFFKLERALTALVKM